ncbi:osmoprotectant transport system permease protein [Paenibacillus sp. yr247]|uniref:ABC transporter permease n=1 Tax=Paenibacillus sp. yr247 TaxID=1761880 RepID=UPI00088B6BEB|nr:ABC transporter permease [Paenibacillus sp. yr247]SDO33321.1 osmoprotectant transport system permease protein [Paenibacillus sp. yr247]
MFHDILDVLMRHEVQVEIAVKSFQHIYLSFISEFIAICFAVPSGIFLTRCKWGAETIMNAVSMLQTIPSLALLAFMIPILGIGTLPTVVALFLYALLPIMRSTYTAIRQVNPSTVEAAKAMGMTTIQILIKVEIPMSVPIIMNGIRMSSVMIIGWATLGAYIGAGGLGDLIMAGFATLSNGHIIAGAVPVTLLALLTDGILGSFEKRMTFSGKRRSAFR